MKRCSNCKGLYTGPKCLECARKRDRAYRRKRLADDNSREVYNKAIWKKCRQNIRVKYNDLDIWLLAEGVILKCDPVYVHHIEELEDNLELMFAEDNLITVSHASHEEIHKYYNTDKAYALDRIARGKAAYNALFQE